MSKEDNRETKQEKADNDKICGVGRDIIEFFDKLNWNVVQDEEYKDCLSTFIPKKNPFQFHTMKLIDSERVPHLEKSISLPPIPEREEVEAEFYVPGVNKTTITIFPKCSVLTRNEQYKLYSFYNRKQTKYKPLSEEELGIFQTLAEKASAELAEFQNFVQQQWISKHSSRCIQVSPDVLRYIDDLWQSKASKCLALYPSSYKSQSHIPLALNDPNNDHTVMEFKKFLLTRGGIKNMSLPNLKKPYPLVSQYEQLCRLKPVNLTPLRIINHACAASIDPKVEECLQNENIDVVITLSGIKAILDLNVAHKEWALPVTVRTVLSEKNKKVVFIDKKLPPAAMSVHDKNVWHAKIASKWALILHQNPLLLDNKPLPPSPSKEQRVVAQYEDEVVELLEEFGVDTGPSSCKRTYERKRKYNTSKESSKPIPTKSGTDLKEEKSLKTENAKQEEAGEQKGLDPTRRKLRQGGPMFQCQEYRLWQLRKATHFNMSKHEQRPVNILVRSRVDGKLLFIPDANGVKVSVSSKLEFQPEFGASRIDSSHLLREYLDLYLRQQAKLVRVRSVGHTGEVMMKEVKSLADIKEAWQTDWLRLFDPLYSVLTRLIDLPQGQYLLHHSAKMGPFVHLLAKNQHGNFSLTDWCRECKPEPVNVPPTQIDPFILTAIHHREKQPPAVFRASNLKAKPEKPLTHMNKRKQRRYKKGLSKRKGVGGACSLPSASSA